MALFCGFVLLSLCLVTFSRDRRAGSYPGIKRLSGFIFLMRLMRLLFSALLLCIIVVVFPHNSLRHSPVFLSLVSSPSSVPHGPERTGGRTGRSAIDQSTPRLTED
jgi:hypothetical protein